MIYAIQCGKTGPIKFGRADDPVKRMGLLQVGQAEPLYLLACELSDDDKAAEKALHQACAVDRIRGEWFRPSRQVIEIVGLMSKGLADVKLFLDRAKQYEKARETQKRRHDLALILGGLRELVRRQEARA